MTADESEAITVLPIVGIAGVGKTAIAQLVYNNPIVESQFEKIWVWVSENFDEVILTKEMLDFVSEESHENFPEENESFQKKERHERMGSYAKLQEMLKGHMKYRSKRFLLILDDVWDSMDNYRWNKLLAPLKSSHTKGNVIVVTTRNLSVA
uniref:NB-ARC domain-containing protein n=1 Tax=Arundo donax TaxID=35708 RepID=A0A0A8YEA6_ARUDO